MTLNYIGSKKTLLPILNQVITNEIGDKCNSSFTFGDGFSGTGCVGQFFSNTYGCNIQSVDMEKYSCYVNRSMLCIPYSSKLSAIIETLNTITGTSGLITKNYSPNGNRMYFTVENANKIDGIREYIELYNNITMDERVFLLSSLLCSADKVANISCVYGSYLKKFKSTALKPFILKPIHTNTTLVSPNNVVLQQDVVTVDWSSCDVVYFDPPYNGRQYGANYFMLNYILDYIDKSSEMRPKTGLTNYYKSEFCQKSSVKQSFKILLDNKTLPRYIFISYNNEGVLNLSLIHI